MDAEPAASHEPIRSLEGTLLPQPWDNDRFPEIKRESMGTELRKPFASEKVSQDLWAAMIWSCGKRPTA